jgi:hypothetical protein
MMGMALFMTLRDSGIAFPIGVITNPNRQGGLYAEFRNR